MSQLHANLFDKLYNFAIFINAYSGDSKISICDMNGFHINECVFASNFSVSFWCWINPKMLAFVVSNALFHWTILSKRGCPVKIFACDSKIMSATRTLVHYTVSENMQWCLLCSAVTNAPNANIARSSGLMQLFSVSQKSSYLLSGSTGCFKQLTLNSTSETVLCFDRLNPPSHTLHMMQLGITPTYTMRPFIVNCSIINLLCSSHSIARINSFYKQEVAKPVFNASASSADDFPIQISACENYNLVFILTGKGYLHTIDIFTGMCLNTVNITNNATVLQAKVIPHSNGILVLTSSGSIITGIIDKSRLSTYISLNFQDSDLKGLKSRLFL